MNLGDWVQGGIGVACLAVLVWTIRSFLNFMGNDMRHLADTLDNLARVIQKCAGPKESEDG